MFFWIVFFIMMTMIAVFYKWAIWRIDRDYNIALEDLRLLRVARELQELGLYETAVFICSRLYLV